MGNFVETVMVPVMVPQLNSKDTGLKKADAWTRSCGLSPIPEVWPQRCLLSKATFWHWSISKQVPAPASCLMLQLRIFPWMLWGACRLHAYVSMAPYAEMSERRWTVQLGSALMCSSPVLQGCWRQFPVDTCGVCIVAGCATRQNLLPDHRRVGNGTGQVELGAAWLSLPYGWSFLEQQAVLSNRG